MKVLIAEDDEGIREGLLELVGEVGQGVGVASAEEATARLRQEPFDLVLTDLRLDGSRESSGRAVIEEAQKAGTPVVLVTAASRSEIQRTVKETGVDAVLPKPFHLDEVTDLLRRFLPAAALRALTA